METFIKCIKASGESVKLPRRRRRRSAPQLLKAAAVHHRGTAFVSFKRRQIPVKAAFGSCRWELGGGFLCHQNDRSGRTSVSGRWERSGKGSCPYLRSLSAVVLENDLSASRLGFRRNALKGPRSVISCRPLVTFPGEPRAGRLSQGSAFHSKFKGRPLKKGVALFFTAPFLIFFPPFLPPRFFLLFFFSYSCASPTSL